LFDATINLYLMNDKMFNESIIGKWSLYVIRAYYFMVDILYM
jgi:hypothetical protein